MSQEKVFRSGFGKLALLFLGIPFLLLAIIGAHTMGRFAEHADRERIAELETTLDQIVAETSNGYFLLKRFNAFARLARNQGIDSPEVVRFRDSFEKNWGMSCSIYTYKNRRLIRTSPPPIAAYQSTFAALLKDMHLSGDSFRQAQRFHNKALLELFGPSNRLELLLANRGKLRRFTRGSHHGAYLWDELPGSYGFLFIILDPPDFKTRFLSVRPHLPKSVGAAVPASQIWFPPAGITVTDMQVALQKTVEEGRNQIQHAGLDWVFCQNSEGNVWCSAKPFPPAGWGGQIGALVIIGYLAAFGFFLLFCLAQFENPLGLMVTDNLEGLSIRVRLSLLFALATVLPLGIAIILGSIGLMDRRELLISEAGRTSLSQISQLEQGYQIDIGKLRRVAEKLRDSPMVKELRLPELASFVTQLVRTNAIQRFEIRDSAGKPFFSTDDPVVHGVSQAMDLFSRVAIRRHASNRLDKENEKISAQDLMGEGFLSSDDFGLAALLRQRRKVWTFKMGTNPCLWFWDVYNDLATGPAFIGVVQQLEYLYESHLRESLAPETASNPTRVVIELGGDSLNLHNRLPIQTAGWLPLLQSMVRCQESGRVLFREIDLPHGRFWVTIKQEITLNMFVLAHMVPVASSLQTLEPIKWRLTITVILSLLISFLGATLISSFFIVPIGDLADGIAAIRLRDATFRIPLRRPDEFGLVAKAFNTLLSELKELQYGRVVQESLLPMNPDAPPGYAIDCMRLPATDLAGDYHDVFRLEDGRWALILGDVTGHGISAALGGGRAKATVDYQSLTGWTVPTQVMENLNRLFYRELKPRQKFMTLCYLALEPATGRIIAENAGHPYPLHYRRATDTIVELPMPSLPLGAKKLRRANPLETTMEPGDVILLYSDGFVECLDSNGDPYNYPRLNALFHELARQNQPLDKFLAVMGKSLREFNGPGPFADDVTLLIIRRL